MVIDVPRIRAARERHPRRKPQRPVDVRRAEGVAMPRWLGGDLAAVPDQVDLDVVIA
jgi:hypothetical protein